eukprot:6111819-Heterocapsa_arctica.AAC.1
MVLSIPRGGELAHHIPEPLTSPRGDVHVIGEFAAAAAHDVKARAETPTSSRGGTNVEARGIHP